MNKSKLLCKISDLLDLFFVEKEQKYDEIINNQKIEITTLKKIVKNATNIDIQKVYNKSDVFNKCWRDKSFLPEYKTYLSSVFKNLNTVALSQIYDRYVLLINVVDIAQEYGCHKNTVLYNTNLNKIAMNVRFRIRSGIDEEDCFHREELRKKLSDTDFFDKFFKALQEKDYLGMK